MADKRMFTKKVTNSDLFLEMPLSTQALYFHLNMEADDDGFNGSPKKIQRLIGASDDDLKVLLAKGFIIPFESGVVVIRHWKLHNYIQKDRYKETIYLDEKRSLEVLENKTYSRLDTKCVQNVYEMDTQISIDKISIDKNSIDIYSPAEAEPIIPYKEIIDHLNSRTGSNYRNTTRKTKDLIKARFNEGFTLEDFKIVIDKKCVEWMNTEMQKYLRPETLFSPKFEGYLNQQIQVKKLTTKDIQDKIDFSDF